MIRKVPMRMCIACREKFDKRELLRIIRSPEGEIAFDPTGKKNGRGMYICRKAECAEKIKNTKLVSSALDISTEKETLEELYKQVNDYKNSL